MSEVIDHGTGAHQTRIEMREMMTLLPRVDDHRPIDGRSDLDRSSGPIRPSAGIGRSEGTAGEASRPVVGSRDVSRWDGADLRLRLYGLARRIVRCDDLAEDAVQEAMLSLWGLPERPHDPAAWLTRAVVFRSLQILRSRHRRRRHEERACSCRSERDPREDAHQAAEQREFAELVLSLLDELPESYRVVFQLREEEGREYGEIAERLRIPIGTVRSRLNRARRVLRDRLRDLQWSPT
jgi:RNA polymerase sigma-70 factor (ECF subfamily)